MSVAPADTFDGGCLCGQVRYSARPARITVMVCHCRACQRQSGSAFSVLFSIPAGDVTWQGELRTHTHAADSGRTIHRRFCPDCGSPVVTEPAEQSGVVFIKAGTLDDPSWLQPTVHLWCQHKQPWIDLPTDRPCLPSQPGKA